MFVSHPPRAYDLFLTAAVSDGIKLWDLRTNRCVRRYDGHVNRSQPVGVAISPCARFIATGSEDRSVSLQIHTGAKISDVLFWTFRFILFWRNFCKNFGTV